METITIPNRNGPLVERQSYNEVCRELQFWKNKYYELKTQVADNKMQQTNPLWIKDHGITRKLLLKDIIMMEADSNYTIIYTSDGHKILSSHTLKNWMATIGDNHEFLRVHRSYLINTNHIVSYSVTKREIYLTGNNKVPVARRFQFHDIFK